VVWNLWDSPFLPTLWRWNILGCARRNDFRHVHKMPSWNLLKHFWGYFSYFLYFMPRWDSVFFIWRRLPFIVHWLSTRVIFASWQCYLHTVRRRYVLISFRLSSMHAVSCWHGQHYHR
jgi:hypothetical protein